MSGLTRIEGEENRDDTLKSEEEIRVESLQRARDEAILRWVLPRVEEAEQIRNQRFVEKWREYYRIWKGEWSPQDRTRNSERSRIIAPATQHAIESQVAEIEEAILGRKVWFDILDDYKDRVQGLDQDLQILRNIALERFEKAGVPKGIADCILNGALYGTLIGKITTGVTRDRVSQPVFRTVQDPNTGQAVQILERYELQEVETLLVFLEPVSPFDFAIDPAATNIEDAEYCVHTVYKPLWVVWERMNDGVYRQADVQAIRVQRNAENEAEEFEGVKLTEFFGLVPETLLDVEVAEDEEVAELFSDPNEIDVDGAPLVEAIITIANDNVVLRAHRNPFWFSDRPFVAAQYDSVPNSFWGRGVAEKGYNAQKALDAEVRARLDGLALSVHPMAIYDITAFPRGNFQVYPGRSIGVSGDPRSAIAPFNFGNINPAIFQSSGDLERMVQQATGSTDPSSPLFVQPTNSTASGTAMALASAIKKSKRVLSNMERNFIVPFLEKAFRRFMQLDPETFPVIDTKFTTFSTLGITARELETQQMIQLLGLVPPNSPLFAVMLKAIYNNSSLANKEELAALIDQMFQPDPQAQAVQQAQLKLALEDAESKIDERKARMAKNIAAAQKDLSEAEGVQDKLDVDIFKEILGMSDKGPQNPQSGEPEQQ